MAEAADKTCAHKHTGSCSPEGIYLYVRCMDCGELLAISDHGKERLLQCPGYTPDKIGRSQTCLNCGFNFWDHADALLEELGKD